MHCLLHTFYCHYQVYFEHVFLFKLSKEIDLLSTYMYTYSVNERERERERKRDVKYGLGFYLRSI